MAFVNHDAAAVADIPHQIARIGRGKVNLRQALVEAREEIRRRVGKRAVEIKDKNRFFSWAQPVAKILLRQAVRLFCKRTGIRGHDFCPPGC